MAQRIRLICLPGPTGSGKSGAANLLAEHAPVEIINADSRQIYTDFPIITAQPGPEETARYSMSLYGYLETDQKSTAWDWAGLARERIQASLAAGTFPVLVGGTGLYFKALLDGMADIPPIEPEIHQHLLDLAEHSLPALYARLTDTDSHYAQKISANDKQRIVRALEVLEQTGRPFSWWHAQTPPPPDWDVLRLGVGLPLPELEPYLAGRIDQMLELGALEEARRALAKWPDLLLPGWSGIGCSELAQHLLGKLTLAQAKSLWLQNTRQYAKRQWTWFRADPRIIWHRPDDLTVFLSNALSFINQS